METKVYYGEYSLEYWIKILLNKDIQIPDYQRSFVWNEKMVKKLLDSLKEGQFVPPVTIGGFRDSQNNKLVNYLIDGQQRLTSLLIAYLKRFPNREEFKNEQSDYAYDGPVAEEEALEDDKRPIKWTLKEFQNKGTKKGSIQRECNEPMYHEFSYLDEFEDSNFLKTHFIGFSYIVPNKDSQEEQQKFYSRLFRDINIQGNKLQPQESRRALYFMRADLETFFEPPFLDPYGLIQVKTLLKVDFVRYLAFTINYANVCGQANVVARGYWRDYEPYYERFVFAIVQDENDDMFGKFTERYPEGDIKPYMLELNNILKALDIEYAYPNYVAMDMYFFGLIYHVVVLKKHIDVNRAQLLKEEIDMCVKDFQNIKGHNYAPNMISKIRDRLETSIKIFEKYTIE